MRRPLSLALVFLAPALVPLGAQSVQLGGLFTFWVTQMLDSALRTQEPASSRPGIPGGTPYYPLHPGFRENGLVIRRAELYLSGRVAPTVTWNLACDPNFQGNILSDATIMWTPVPPLTLRVGQFRPLQGYEATIVPAAQLLFYDRSILSRQFGDKWDRGATLTWTLKRGGTDIRLAGGVFNGGGRANDLNAQKDWVGRIDVETSRGLRFGAYGLHGGSDANPGAAVAYGLPGAGAPGAETILDANDLTTNVGAYAVVDRGRWHGVLEVMGGRLGRRYPTLGAPPAQPAARQHLDQAFQGLSLTGVFRWGRQAVTARYDLLDYNAGGRWYGSDPYLTPQGDFTPRFTETVLGWNLALADTARWRSISLKVNAIHRTGPILLPAPGHVGPEAGDSLVGILQVGF